LCGVGPIWFNDTPGQDGFFIPVEEDILAALLQGFLKFGRKSSSVRKSSIFAPH
jgi:hypothetical protein